MSLAIIYPYIIILLSSGKIKSGFNKTIFSLEFIFSILIPIKITLYKSNIFSAISLKLNPLLLSKLILYISNSIPSK